MRAEKYDKTKSADLSFFDGDIKVHT